MVKYNFYAMDFSKQVSPLNRSDTYLTLSVYMYIHYYSTPRLYTASIQIVLAAQCKCYELERLDECCCCLRSDTRFGIKDL